MLKISRAIALIAPMLACSDASSGPAEEEPTEEILVYFTRAGAPQAVKRTIFPTFEPLPIAVGELLEGPTSDERASGYTSLFFAGTASAFDRIEIRGDSLVIIELLDFSHLAPAGGTPAGATMVLGELNHTVFQFPFVKSIIYRFNGSCTRFFEWLNQTCRTIRRDALGG